jgi:hypothetical protein
MRHVVSGHDRAQNWRETLTTLALETDEIKPAWFDPTHDALGRTHLSRVTLGYRLSLRSCLPRPPCHRVAAASCRINGCKGSNKTSCSMGRSDMVIPGAQFACLPTKDNARHD